jgi:predicted lysophospholipase L1 biosynthesis ABC-type transport system permease subunit
MTVVGVVGNIRRSSLDDNIRSEFYWPYAQISEDGPSGWPFTTPVNRVSFVIKTPLPPSEVRRAMAPVVFGLDRSLAIAELSTLRDSLDSRLEERRGLLRLFVALSSLTLVSRGDRPVRPDQLLRSATSARAQHSAALGASRRQIVWLPMRDSVIVLSIGLPIGLLLSIGAAGQLQQIVSSVEPYEWRVLFMAMAVLAGCTLIAAYAAARRGARADPNVYMNAG